MRNTTPAPQNPMVPKVLKRATSVIPPIIEHKAATISKYAISFINIFIAPSLLTILF